jgi:hypothetical protein
VVAAAVVAVVEAAAVVAVVKAAADVDVAAGALVPVVAPATVVVVVAPASVVLVVAAALVAVVVVVAALVVVVPWTTVGGTVGVDAKSILTEAFASCGIGRHTAIGMNAKGATACVHALSAKPPPNTNDEFTVTYWMNPNCGLMGLGKHVPAELVAVKAGNVAQVAESSQYRAVYSTEGAVVAGAVVTGTVVAVTPLPVVVVTTTPGLSGPLPPAITHRYTSPAVPLQPLLASRLQLYRGLQQLTTFKTHTPL